MTGDFKLKPGKPFPGFFWYNKIKRNLGESYARKTFSTLGLVTILLFFSLD